MVINGAWAYWRIWKFVIVGFERWERTHVSLAKLLLSEPALLILD